MNLTDILSKTDDLVLVWLVIGAAGSLVEKVGLLAKSDGLIATGKTLESLSVDLPKLFGVVLGVFKK